MEISIFANKPFNMFVPNFMAIHPVVVKIIQSGQKWWTDQPTY